MAVADTVELTPLPAVARRAAGSWVGCAHIIGWRPV